ncbi:transcription factor bHLH30-like [Gastrolobium bilobum]|uniref:transcription factor bHLH30-like n=1 Tax=Gastrolobium bilobum TaxID=150636 RepID=UPI002AB01B5D|nr:transcription factor bHLH30-like [Gastrolobium bilobum]
MFYSFYDKKSSSGSDISRLFNPTLHNLGASNDVSRVGLSSSQYSLVFEREKGELVKCSATERAEKNEISDAKALAAMKSHCEAERRRRDKINAHFATLRGLVPSSEKMDKATLLAEVISQVKELKTKAVEASKGILIPMDADEVNVVPNDDDVEDGSMSYSATICCDYQPELLSDLGKTFDTLQLPVKAKISTLGGRMKNVFIYTCCEGDNINMEACQAIASTVHEALSSVLVKASKSLEYSLRRSRPSKRRRLCFINETSTSPCNNGSCSC